jgi:hypothetical protein
MECSVIIVVVTLTRVLMVFAVSCICVREKTRLVKSDYYISKMETMLHDVDVLG